MITTRNPIYSAMLPTVCGLVLMVPSVLALAAIVTLFVGLELQVRLVEEPYLQQVHGDAYAAYAAHVGRFVPKAEMDNRSMIVVGTMRSPTLLGLPMS